jgi:hypothetical protein
VGGGEGFGIGGVPVADGFGFGVDAGGEGMTVQPFKSVRLQR